METLKVIKTKEEILSLIEYLKQFDYISTDTETTGVRVDSEIVGISVCGEMTTAYYIITAEWCPETKQLIRHGTRKEVIQLLQLLKTKQLIMHNGIFDCHMIRANYGIELIDALHTDTMVLSHLVDENEPCGLKERAALEFGEDEKKEAQEMKASVIARGGIWQDKKKDAIKEMYKADPYILGKYGAKDAILTLKLFNLYVPMLFEQGLDKFFYEDESMPLFREVTYDLNYSGFKIDTDYLNQLEIDLTKEINELHAKILFDIHPYVKDKYPGTNEKNTFNIGASQQLAWLLHVKLGHMWNKLTDSGREVAKAAIGRIPYSNADKIRLAETLRTYVNEKGKAVKLESVIKCDKTALNSFKLKYQWVADILEYRRLSKLLETYVLGMKARLHYGSLYPSFLQCGTRGTRFSSRNVNFQNLPRDDTRIKRAVVAKPGRVIVIADAAQGECRVFASYSGDYELQKCFEKGEDFYSVVGMRVFNKTDCTPYKEGSADAFGVKYKKLRQTAKCIALAITYGATAPKIAELLDISIEEAKQIIESYWAAYPTLKEFVDRQHEAVVRDGVIYNLFGRPRRLPAAKDIAKYGGPHMEGLDYEYKKLLNLAVNSPIQNTLGSFINRSLIRAKRRMRAEGIDAKVFITVHDENGFDVPEKDAHRAAQILKEEMEYSEGLVNVRFEAKPIIATNLADAK